MALPLTPTQYHSKLVRTLTLANDLLYPIEQVDPTEIVSRGAQIVNTLSQWEASLPPFLKPRPSSGLGTQTWERQNSVLGLALAHARILATRRCLLIAASTFSPGSEACAHHSNNVRVCLTSICDVIDRVLPMVTHGRLLWGFWLTQYIAMCAISTLFVYKIQRRRGSISTTQGEMLSYVQDDPILVSSFQKAEEIQDYLSRIAPEGSQAKRHHNLLSRLRQRATKSHHHVQQIGRLQTVTASKTQQQAPQSPLDRSRGGQFYDVSCSISDQLPLLSASEDAFTPSMMFDSAFPDASSWQYLDQLGSIPLQLDVDAGGVVWV